jgi:predicted metal-binding membrane protein
MTVAIAPAGQRAFLAVSAVLFAASAAATITWCGAMSAMDGMAMPGGWTMSMAWMRMPGQTWPGAAASFLGMWLVMMAAMMLPTLAPALGCYRAAVAGSGATRLDRLTALVAGAYFMVWTALGMAVFPLGVALAEAAMRLPALARALPATGGLVVLAAGAFQFSAWKARQLACCRQAPCRRLAADAATALRHGVRLGLDCVRCCAGPTAVLLVLGVMDLRVMAAVTAAISAERLAPAGARMARLSGVVAVGAGLLLLAQGAGVA